MTRNVQPCLGWGAACQHCWGRRKATGALKLVHDVYAKDQAGQKQYLREFEEAKRHNRDLVNYLSKVRSLCLHQRSVAVPHLAALLLFQCAWHFAAGLRIPALPGSVWQRGFARCERSIDGPLCRRRVPGWQCITPARDACRQGRICC